MNLYAWTNSSFGIIYTIYTSTENPDKNSKIYNSSGQEIGGIDGFMFLEIISANTERIRIYCELV